MYEEANTRTNLPAQIELYATSGDAYEFLFLAKGACLRACVCVCVCMCLFIDIDTLCACLLRWAESVRKDV